MTEKLAMGIYDDLDQQIQPILYIDPVLSNIIVFGGHMSGKTTFLKTLLVRLHESGPEAPKRDIYVLDFGGNLGEYRDLGRVAACFDSSSEENVRRVFKTIESRLEENSKNLFSKQFAEIYGRDENSPPHIMLFIDNVTSFLADDRYEAYHDLLLRFCRDGLSKGLTVVFTANDVSGGLGRYMGSFNRKFALPGSADKYIDIFGMKVNEPMGNAGRGVTIIDGKPRECQIFLPFMDEEKGIAALNERCRALGIETEKLVAFRGALTEENFFEYLSPRYDISDDPNKDEYVVGLDYYEHLPVSVDFNEIHSIAIYGKKKFGKTNLLKLLLDSVRKSHSDHRFVYFDDGRKQLEELYNKDKGSNKSYVTNIEQLYDLLDSEGYAAKMGVGGINKNFTEKDTPPTVFILQNKMLFQAAGAQLLKQVFPKMIARAEEKNYWFIFSDVRKISNNDRDAESSLNTGIAVAFLLDSIADFVTDRGNRSVFGEMDPKELKSEYARCELGDGYFYDIESDDLKKLKFLKAE